MRFPYSSVTCESGLASTEVAIDSIGVMPEPAAMQRCRPASEGSAWKLPVGVCTSTASPALTSCTSQDENIPSGISRTPTRGLAPTGAQIEYERRCSCPSIVRRSVRDCPALKSNAARRSSGTSKVTATESSVRCSTAATVSSWNVARGRAVEAGTAVSDTVMLRSP